MQVLRGKGDLPKARKDAMAAASNAKEFVSHCAAEGGDTVTPEKMTIAQLRSTLLVCAPTLLQLFLGFILYGGSIADCLVAAVRKSAAWYT